jgi:nucleotide-binding universal stress UspA family protein
MQILAATDFSTRSHRALRRAGLLAQARGAELAIVHVVDDDDPKDLVDIESREAERILGEQIGAIAELRGAPPGRASGFGRTRVTWLLASGVITWIAGIVVASGWPGNTL